MPGTTRPLDGKQAFVAEFQALNARIASLETWQRQQPAYTRGIAFLTFTASADAGPVAVSHGLPGTPTVIIATAKDSPGFGQIVIPDCANYGPSTFNLYGQTTSAWTGTAQVAWVAYP